MPWAPKRPCAHPGCKALTDTGRCDAHRIQERQVYDRGRQNDPFRKLYSSRRWRVVRLMHLAREPLCRECRAQGRVTAAVIVDHIKPMKHGGDAWDSANHQSLCASCHSSKSTREGSRYGGGEERKDVETQGYVIA